MAVQKFVFGPTTIEWGPTPTLLGQSDGQTLVTIQEVAPWIEVPTDGFGGEPEDFVQQMAHVLVTISFVEWDHAEMMDIIGTRAADGTADIGSTPFKYSGGAVGTLRLADGGTEQLVITGTKLTAANGGYKITFPTAFIDPDSVSEWSDIGSRNSRRQVVFRAHQEKTLATPIYSLEDVA